MRAKQAHKNFLVARGHWADINRRRAAITRRQTSAAATEFGFLMSPRRNCRIDGQQTAAGSEARIAMNDFRAKFVRWLGRTPVQTFLLCPLAVVLFELAINRGRLTIVPWGLPLLAFACCALAGIAAAYTVGFCSSAGNGPTRSTPAAISSGI
jgi:hypothetical protein